MSGTRESLLVCTVQYMFCTTVQGTNSVGKGWAPCKQYSTTNLIAQHIKQSSF